MFEPENDLEKSLVQAYKEPAQRSQFYRALLDADIYAITTKPPALDDKGAVRAGARISFQHYERKGTLYVPIFSSLNRLQESIKDPVTYSKINGSHFFTMTRGEAVIMNPGLELGKAFSPTEIADMLDGTIFQPREPDMVDKDTRATIGQAATYPEKLVDALSELFKEHAEVKTAYLSMVVTDAEAKKADLMVGIDAGGDWPALVDAAQAVAAEQAPGEPVHFIRMDGSPLSEHMAEHIEPFYLKGQAA